MTGVVIRVRLCWRFWIPEQNTTFNDHYMEMDYDLSDVMFICTANSLDMPQPLLDRMEIIRISGYTEDEKLEIVKRHLLKKQIKAAGLKESEFSISDATIRDLIRYYTRVRPVYGIWNVRLRIYAVSRLKKF